MSARNQLQSLEWAGIDTIQKTLAKSSRERLSGTELMLLEIQMLSPLDVMKNRYCPAAFNAVSHTCRVARILASEMSIWMLGQAVDAASAALHELFGSEEEKPVATRTQMDKLDEMVGLLLVVMPEVPRPLWMLADHSARETILRRMVGQYMQRPYWARHAAIDIMMGIDQARLAEQASISVFTVEDEMLTVAAILYAIKGDSTLPFPDSIDQLRAMKDELMPVASLYELELTKQSSRRVAA
ncbi:hypothetical protein LH460_06210 [Laribacter hongkongensis]|uniref:hypothetical protein n=1 Tax=Laribacter hongkongensis TaxID=168471 RepID=UPI001EFDFBEB|nr:hypothetical protein [Laribacter hongkongensis]MCG9124264.1 hypothetical protein [Laribacter hongkongensis]